LLMFRQQSHLSVGVITREQSAASLGYVSIAFIIANMYYFCFCYCRMKDEMEDVPYVPSDSADEFSDTEKILLEKVRREVNSDSDESEVSSCS